MNNSLNFTTQSEEETDSLLEQVNKQIADSTFDTSDRQLLKSMVECFGDSRGMVRLGFAEALGVIGKPAVPVLLEALANHTNVVVRRAAAKTLIIIADPEAVPNLIHALLHDEDTVVKGSSVGALAKTGETAVPALLEILASPEHPQSTIGHAAWALAFIGVEAKEHLYKAIDSDSAEVRAAVLGGLVKVAEQDSDKEAFDILIKSLGDRATNVRSEAAAALGNLTYQPAVPNLIELLNHQEGETRKSAALSLMKIGDRAAIEPLQAASSTESEEGVKRAIDLAISQLEQGS